MDNFTIKTKSLEMASSIYGAIPSTELTAHASVFEKYFSGTTETPQFTLTDATKLLDVSTDFAAFLQHLKIINPSTGLQNFEPYPFQLNLAHAMQRQRWLSITMARQMGTTTMLCAYALWKSLIKPGITTVMIGYKFAAALEMMERIRLMHQHVPAWLQPSIDTNNKSQLVFDNGSRIIARAATTDAVRGFSANMVIVDQANYVSRNTGLDLMQVLIPVIASGHSTQLILAGTPNGFHDGMLWESRKDSNFVNFSANWQEHPDRDPTWAQSMRNTIGDEQFQREYQPSFNEDAPE